MAIVKLGPRSVVWTPEGEAPATFRVIPLSQSEVIRRYNETEVFGPPEKRSTAEHIEMDVAVAVKQTVGWTGIDDGESPLECTEANKRAVFALYPEPRMLVLEACYPMAGPAKNGSRGGSASSSSIPESHVAKSTSTAPSAETQGPPASALDSLTTTAAITIAADGTAVIGSRG